MGKVQPLIENLRSLKLSPRDVDAEIDRIQNDGPLLGTERDDSLHDWIDEQRQSGNPGFICSSKGSGVSYSCQAYRMKHVKRKGLMQQLPVPVVYIQVPVVCSLSTFHKVILQALNHGIPSGRLRDMRPRVRGTLKNFGTQLIIIDDAEFLNYDSFCEVVQIYDMLKIPTVLSGTYELERVFEDPFWYRVGNSFLNFREYPAMSEKEMRQLIEGWENFLKWPEESDLLHEDNVKNLYDKTKGLRDPLFEILRKASVRTLKQGSYKITTDIINSVLKERITPLLKPNHRRKK